ncbi:E3 SUMO-protein ligase ZBED1-like isoform 2-T2 [Menidia menidia]
MPGRRSLHPDEPRGSRKQVLDEAVANLIVKDSQPFSVVEDEGFRELIHLLDPTYVLPTRKALKKMVEDKFYKTKEKAKEDIQKVTAVSLTADMWTSMNMEAYLAITCHFIDPNDKLSIVLIGVEHFPYTHTSDNLARVVHNHMAEWGITDKVNCLVTDAAANMIACAKALKIRHSICIAHGLNLLVRKSFDQIPDLCDIRAKAKRIVAYFHSSTTGKERLEGTQIQMGRQSQKLIIDVDTRWNSTYLMLERLFQQKEPVAAALTTLKTDIIPLTSQDYEIIEESLPVLFPFFQATSELSEEKRVSISKVIPLMNMLHHAVLTKMANIKNDVARLLSENLLRRVKEQVTNIESLSVMTMATLLDPRFKTLGFLSQSKAQEAVRRLKAECSTLIASNEGVQLQESGDAGEGASRSCELWSLLDTTVDQKRHSSNATADAIVEVERYLAEKNLRRHEDPLVYWHTQKHVHPHLYCMALKFLCSPASSVPCERVFSKAGEVICRRRNRLKPETVKKVLFLNKNN